MVKVSVGVKYSIGTGLFFYIPLCRILTVELLSADNVLQNPQVTSNHQTPNGHCDSPAFIRYRRVSQDFGKECQNPREVGPCLRCSCQTKATGDEVTIAAIKCDTSCIMSGWMIQSKLLNIFNVVSE